MKSNEDNKTWISNILVRSIFLCLKQVYCCLTFVCVYMYMYVRRLFIVLSRHFGGYSVKEIEEIITDDQKAECNNKFLTHIIIQACNFKEK